jgi:hypothetical protein
MREVVQFPGINPPPEGYSEQHLDKVHGQAFRDLESNLRDCVRTGIAAELMLNTRIEDDQLRFAVFHSAKMLMCLEKEYDAGWHSEKLPL